MGQFVGLERQLGEARLVIDRHRRAIFLGLLHVIDVDVVTKHRAGIPVFARYWGAGKGHKRRVGQCVAQVLGIADLIARRALGNLVGQFE